MEKKTESLELVMLIEGPKMIDSGSVKSVAFEFLLQTACYSMRLRFMEVFKDEGPGFGGTDVVRREKGWINIKSHLDALISYRRRSFF